MCSGVALVCVRRVGREMSSATPPTGDAAKAMRSYWDAKAREDVMYYIHNVLDYAEPDEVNFWASGRQNLVETLAPFGRAISSDDDVVEIGCGIGRITWAIASDASQ